MTEDNKKFLLSFKEETPQWDLLPFSYLESLPALKWKFYNIRQISKDHSSYYEGGKSYI